MAAKRWLQRVLPTPLVRAGSFLLDHSLPRRRRNLPWERRQRVIDSLIARHVAVVQGGPFRGLVLPQRGVWGNLAPLLVGSYEQELHGVIEELIASEPSRVINVGSAEGYYAVGFARRLPRADVYAFDIDERARRTTRETAAANGVSDRIAVAAECRSATLEEVLVPGSLLIVDCEGCELELLDPEQVSSLQGATILVELHDYMEREISFPVLSKFTATHSIRIVRATERSPALYTASEHLRPKQRALAVDELRLSEPHPTEWALMTPLSGSPEMQQ
jgi:hypothetical protein